MRKIFLSVLVLSFQVHSSCQDEIDSVKDGKSIVKALSCLNTKSNEMSFPNGSILVWDPVIRNSDGTDTGELRSIPSGWTACNGKNSTVNLDKKFLYGTSTLAYANNVGGVEIIPEQDSHKHTATTESKGPVDRHVPCSGNCFGRYISHQHSLTPTENGKHNHGGNNLPPYVTVVFLCKIDD